MNARIHEISAGHLPMVSHPNVVAGFILGAVAGAASEAGGHH
jgi:hypothetical protein